MKIPVQIITDKLNHTFGLPKYETAGAAGMDIRSNENALLLPKETRLIKTGIYVAIPEGWEIQIRPRSGMSLKTKLRIANAPGTVDSDYRGEVCIIAENTHGSEDIHIGVGDRIAQMVLNEVPQIEWECVKCKDELGTTQRGAGGFGSSGK